MMDVASSDGESEHEARDPTKDGGSGVGNSVNTGRGHTKRKQTEHYGFAARPTPHKKPKQQRVASKRKRESAETGNERKAGSQNAGPRKLMIRIGKRAIARIEGTYEDNNAPT